MNRINLSAVALIFISGCARLDSPNFKSRLAAVRKVTDQKVLASVAVNDIAPTVRIAAIEKLDDQSTLQKIAVNVGYDSLLHEVRQAAIARITDQEFLQRLALTDNSPYVRMAAVYRITDQNLLAHWAGDKSLPKDVRLAAAGTISDRALNEQMVQDCDIHIGEIAQLRLFVSNPLVESRLGKTKLFVHWYPWNKGYYYFTAPPPGFSRSPDTTVPGEDIHIIITSDNLPKPVEDRWITDWPSEVRDTSFRPAYAKPIRLMRKLLAGFPQVDLAKLATDYNDWHVRCAATENLDDQQTLAKVACGDTDFRVRQSAVEKLADQTILAEIALNDTNSEVSLAAAEKLKSQPLIEKVALKAQYAAVRRAAAWNLKNKATLAYIAAEDPSEDVRSYVVEKKIVDRLLLAKLSKQDPSEKVRNAAKIKLK